MIKLSQRQQTKAMTIIINKSPRAQRRSPETKSETYKKIFLSKTDKPQGKAIFVPGVII